MIHLAKKITLVTCAVVVAVFSANILTAMDAYADSPGNNGTLKLHEQGTLSGTESNDSHACVFNFEGFQFDESQQGQIRIEGQGGSQNGVEVLGPIPFGAANADGGVETAYVNDGVSGFNLDNGHYKATLYGKNGEVLNGNKAKSKVFWVDCPAKTPTASVQAGTCIAPGATDGTATGSVTNTDDPTNVAVTYTVKATGPVTRTTTITVADGATGTFSFSGLPAGSYTVTVAGDDGTSVAPLSFVITVCDIPVAPNAPSQKDVCGIAGDTYTIPSQAGVTYYVNNVATGAGTYVATGLTIITAVANSGYVLTQGATASWTFNFTNDACPTPNITAAAVCSQTGVLVTLKNDGNGDSVATVNGDDIAVAAHTSVDVVVPYTLFKADVLVNGDDESLLIDKTFDCTPGRGSITPPIVTPPVVKAVSPAPVAELPMTGSAASPIQLVVMLILAVTTYGATYYLQDRISFISKK